MDVMKFVASGSTFFTPEEIGAVRRPLNEASLAPPRVYADDAIYALERERVFMHHWLPFCRASQVAKPGSYVSRTLFDEPVIVARDESGALHAMSNVCRHRNRQITDDGLQCSDQKRLVCPYHGWVYGLDGNIVNTPNFQQAVGFDKQNYRLPQFQIDIWQGWVFINFDPATEKLSSQLATLDKVLEPYHLADMECFDFEEYPAPWNWKATLENFTEAYHQVMVHRDTAEPVMPSALTRYEDVDGPYNLFYMPYAPNLPFLESFPTIPGLTGKQKTTAVVVNVFPYFHLLIDPTSVMWLDMDIRSARDHHCIWRMMLPSGSMAAPNFSELKESTRKVIKPVWDEDFAACSGVNKGVQSRFAVQGRLSHMEKSVHQFQNWMMDRYLER